jgi:hypothetical protein
MFMSNTTNPIHLAMYDFPFPPSTIVLFLLSYSMNFWGIKEYLYNSGHSNIMFGIGNDIAFITKCWYCCSLGITFLCFIIHSFRSFRSQGMTILNFDLPFAPWPNQCMYVVVISYPISMVRMVT